MACSKVVWQRKNNWVPTIRGIRKRVLQREIKLWLITSAQIPLSSWLRLCAFLFLIPWLVSSEYSGCCCCIIYLSSVYRLIAIGMLFLLFHVFQAKNAKETHANLINLFFLEFSMFFTFFLAFRLLSAFSLISLCSFRKTDFFLLPFTFFCVV